MLWNSDSVCCEHKWCHHLTQAKPVSMTPVFVTIFYLQNEFETLQADFVTLVYFKSFSNLTTIMVCFITHYTPKTNSLFICLSMTSGLSNTYQSYFANKPNNVYIFLTIKTLWVTSASSKTQKDEGKKKTRNQWRNQQGLHQHQQVWTHCGIIVDTGQSVVFDQMIVHNSKITLLCSHIQTD